MSFDTAFDDADLNGYADGRLEPARAAALTASLASDPEARARVDAWKRQNEGLRTMFASVLFEPIPVRLLPSSLPARPPAPAREAVRRPRPMAMAMAMTSIGTALVGFALGALASFGTDRFGLSGRATPGTGLATETQRSYAFADQPFARLAAETHRTVLADAGRPLEPASAEEPRLLHGIRQRLGNSLRIPDLGRQGWALLGGRIVPGAHGPAAFLVYGHNGDRVGLTVARAPEPGTPATGEDGAPVAVTTWSDDAYRYALTSERGADWMDRNAGPLREDISAQVRAPSTLP